ncbi:MAG TPA: hypothetical protein VHJ38_04020 [Nitrososphaeraceae archaeon]|nr:hypothetical protein [Nitrososphaeraceae archaeon]
MSKNIACVISELVGTGNCTMVIVGQTVPWLRWCITIRPLTFQPN